MALTWNIKNVRDWEELQTTDWGITEALIWATMTIGMNKLTDVSADEFYARISLLETLHGSLTNVKGQPVLMGREDIERRIGLATNASSLTRTQFNKKMLDRFYRDKMEQNK